MYAICVSGIGNACILNFPILPRSHVHSVSKVFFICKIKIVTMYVSAYPECTKNALKRTSECKRVPGYGYVLELEASPAE